MRIIIAGATGLIGQSITRKLLEMHHEVIVITRNPSTAQKIFGNLLKYSVWEINDDDYWLKYCEGLYAIINLAGENIGKGRWTKTRKKEILDSRIDSCRAIYNTLKTAKQQPETIIQASAIGFYEPDTDEYQSEFSLPGKRYLSELVLNWETEAMKLMPLAKRLIIIRTGVVLSKNEGLFAKVLATTRRNLGGQIGSGRQWLSWIHITDETNAIIHLLENENIEGIYNLTAPGGLKMGDFLRITAKTAKKPYWLKVPSFAIKLLFGEMGKELILSGEKVSSKKLEQSGYTFCYPMIDQAIKNLLNN